VTDEEEAVDAIRAVDPNWISTAASLSWRVSGR
jgi:hypothetical protein